MDDRDLQSAIVKSMSDGVITADKKGLVSFINPAAEALTGWSGATAAGKPLKDVFNVVDESTGKPLKDLTPKGGEASHVLEAHRTKLVAKTGSSTPIEGVVTPIKEGAGASKGVAVVFRKVATKKGAAQAGIATELLEQSPTGMLYCDMNGEIVFANKALASMHRRKTQDIVKKHRSVLHTSEQMMAVDEANLKILERGEFKGELRHIRADGSEFSTYMQSSIVRDKGSKPLGIVSAVIELVQGKEAVAACPNCKELERKLADVEASAAENTRELAVSKKELQNYVESLEKTNEALKLVIEGIEEQRKDEEKKVSHNISLTIRPILDQLKSQDLTQTAGFLLKSLEFNLGNMFSSAGFKIIKDGHLLTPKEIRICEMIGSGLSSKQIAKVMAISPQTVLVHRKNIRKKLGLAKSRQNLASYLRANL
ncbi:MAG: PAS domain S-box protein [Thermodesulfobacteriota bacterium]